MKRRNYWAAALMSVSCLMLGATLTLELMTDIPGLMWMHRLSKTHATQQSIEITNWINGTSNTLKVPLTGPEMRHLEDVKELLGFRNWLFVLSVLTLSLIAFDSIQAGTLRQVLRYAIRIQLLSIVAMALTMLVAILNWNIAFTLFHEVLFPPGTWQFPIDSTLIQLYPEQFWSTGALLFFILFILCVITINSTLHLFGERENRPSRLAG